MTFIGGATAPTGAMDARVARIAEGMAMNQARVGLLVAAALVAMPATALAQPKGQPAKAAAGKKDPKKDGHDHKH